MFSSVFGASISQTAISQFADAVKLSLSSNGVDVNGIFTTSILPGSIIVDVSGTPTTVVDIQSVVNAGKYSVPYNGNTYYLVGQHRDDVNSSGKYLICTPLSLIFLLVQ